MRLLIFDHFFNQDIDALMYARPDHEIRIIPCSSLTSLASFYFHPRVFEGLAEYHKEEYWHDRETWASKIDKIMELIYSRFHFDAFVLPSDTYFYIRAAIEWARGKGIPCIVVQKETSISSWVMETHAEELKVLFPVISDVMTVCSERHKAFWIQAGTASDRIVVSGQPRFDFYSQPERWRTLKSLGIHPSDQNKRIIFFLSYDLNAYTPTDNAYGLATGVENSQGIWSDLHTETVQGLLDLVGTGSYCLLIKPHPQQRLEQVNEWKQYIEMTGQSLNKDVFFLPPLSDTRQFIVNADVIVGFQTTALFEAIAAGKPVIYTFCGDGVCALRDTDTLLPFHTYPEEVLKCARSRNDLKGMIKGAVSPEVDMRHLNVRREIFEEHLGRIDGQASERVLQVIERLAHPVMRTPVKLKGDGVSNFFGKHRYGASLFLFFLVSKGMWYFFEVLLRPVRNQRFLWRIYNFLALRKRRYVVELDVDKLPCVPEKGFR